MRTFSVPSKLVLVYNWLDTGIRNDENEQILGFLVIYETDSLIAATYLIVYTSDIY